MHMPPRQGVPRGARPSVGQAALSPVQVSCTSHSPADDRQIVSLERKSSGGHASLAPSQASATSHTPVEARQTVPGGWPVQGPGVRPPHVPAMQFGPLSQACPSVSRRQADESVSMVLVSVQAPELHMGVPTIRSLIPVSPQSLS